MMQSGLRSTAPFGKNPENGHEIARKPLLAKECRSRDTQSQQYLMSYIRHIYCRERSGRRLGLYDEMRA